MVVEDDHDLRVSLRSVLEDEGYEVFTASHGAQAIEMLRGLGVRPELAIVDLHLPIMNGWELIRMIRADTDLAALPVVVITVNPAPGPIEATAVLRKPLDLEQLLGILQRHTS